MSLSRSNSTNNLNATTPRDKIPKETHSDPDKNSSPRLSTNSSTSLLDQKARGKIPKIDIPTMKVKIPAEQTTSPTTLLDLSPRSAPKSPRNQNSSNLPSNERGSPRKDLSTSPSIKEKEKKESTLISTTPTIQVRRANISFPTRLLDEAGNGLVNTPSSTTSSTTASISTINSDPAVTTNDSPPSIKEVSSALLSIIFNKYETTIIKPSSVTSFGRLDMHFAVKAIPKTLTHLTEFPDNGITSISELLIKLFGEKLKKTPAWKKVEFALKGGKSLDDGSVPFDEMDPDIKRKHFALLKPHALNIADSIFGTSSAIKGSALPADLINLLYEGDEKLLKICLTATKFRTKEINDVRLNFLFDMVVTRFVQVLATHEFSDYPSKVDSWFLSAIIKALGDGINGLSFDFLVQSNNRLPEDLKTTFLKKIDAEIREEEAIKKFKLIEIKKNRIAELQKKDMENSKKKGHSRLNSHAQLTSKKLEDNYKNILTDIKKECGFDAMDAGFLTFISKNKNLLFNPDLKVTKSNIVIDLKQAIREYEGERRLHGLPSDEKVQPIIDKLDVQLKNEFGIKLNRRTTAYSKDIKFSSNLSQTDESKDSTSKSSTIDSTVASSTASTSTSTTSGSTSSTSSTTTATSVIPPQSDFSEVDENSENSEQ